MFSQGTVQHTKHTTIPRTVDAMDIIVAQCAIEAEKVEIAGSDMDKNVQGAKST